MAKTIKFNLICDGVPVRTIEDLQNNFSVEDVLAYYKNGILKKWLSVRGYDEELKKVEAITEVDSKKIITELIQIFGVECDPQKIKKDLYSLFYEKIRNERNDLYREKEEKIQQIIDRKMQEYESLIEKMVREFPDNTRDISDCFCECKVIVQEIVTYYSWIFEKDNRRIFYKLKERDNWLAVACLLMNEKTRRYYIPASVDEKRLKLENQTVTLDKFSEKEQDETYVSDRSSVSA